MADICGDNRFKIIKKAKAELLESTNIETSEDEMKVLDNFLFRCWQMGWLERYDKPRNPFDIPTISTDFVKEQGLPCPNGYIFKDENGNEINAQKIVLEKKTVEEKYNDVKIQIFGNVVILKGGINADNPTEYMNEVVHYILDLLGKPKHNQFIEEYLDNPWVRILIFDFNSMKFNNSFDDIVTNFKQ